MLTSKEIWITESNREIISTIWGVTVHIYPVYAIYFTYLCALRLWVCLEIEGD